MGKWSIDDEKRFVEIVSYRIFNLHTTRVLSGSGSLQIETMSKWCAKGRAVITVFRFDLEPLPEFGIWKLSDRFCFHHKKRHKNKIQASKV